MEITDAILSCGVKATRRYNAISDCENDNQVPELFITSLMSTYLYDELPWHNVKLERQYLDVATELGLDASSEAHQLLSLLRSDVAIYEGSLPIVLIEVKKFDERVHVDAIDKDLHKGDVIGLGKHVGIFAGVMVCETNVRLDVRKTELEQIPGSRWAFSSAIRSVNREWYWCFGCGNIPS